MQGVILFAPASVKRNPAQRVLCAANRRPNMHAAIWCCCARHFSCSPKAGAGGTAPPTRRSSGASGDNAAGVPLNSALGVLSIRATTDGETRRQLVSRTVLVKPASLLTCHRPPPHAEGCIALTNKSRRRPLNGSRKKSPCSILFIATLSKVGARKTPNPTFNRTPFRRRLIPRYAANFIPRADFIPRNRTTT